MTRVSSFSVLDVRVERQWRRLEIEMDDYTTHEYWVSQKPPMAVKVVMAKEVIKQGLTEDVFVHKNMEGVTDPREYDWFGQDWRYAYSLAKEEQKEPRH
jgi:hypothetical protein